ncbi:outer membrane protein porin [Tanacetum coccineum]
MYMNSWDKLSLEPYKAKCEKLEKENEKYIITFSSLYDNDRQYTKKIKEQEDLIDTMSDQLAELKNTVKIKQTTISELKECLRKKDSENEHLKSKVVDFTTVQNLHVQVEELKSVNECLNLSVEELSKARTLAEATLRERDELISNQYEKYCALKETESLKGEIKSLQTENKVLKSGESELSEKIDQMKSQVSKLSEKLHISDQEMKQQINLCKEGKRMFLAKNEFLEKVSSLVQKEYNDLLASNDVFKQRLETKFKFLKHDNSLEKMIEMIEKENESNVSKISITSSMLENKNLELVKEMGDKMKCFDEEKKVFKIKILKLKKVLAQRVKDFDDVKTELSKRINKFETYFVNLEKQNDLLKSQLASQNYTSLQMENNDLRTSYNVLKEKYETFCEKLEKENNDLKMHYKILFDSIKQKKVGSQVFRKSIPKVNVPEKIYTDYNPDFKEKKVHALVHLSLKKKRSLLRLESLINIFQNFYVDVDRKEEILFGRMIHRKNGVIVSQSPLGPSYHLQVVLKLCFSRFRCDLTLSSLLEWIIKIGKSEKIRTLEFYGRAPVLSVHPHRLDPTMGENKELLAPEKKGQTTIHVIGWDQGLLGMCAREKCKLKIPFKMGYGERASPPKIPGSVAQLVTWMAIFMGANTWVIRSVGDLNGYISGSEQQLELGVTGTIVLMLCRMWDVYATTGRYLSTDFVVCDSKGNTMHAIARNSIAHNVIKLKEGGIYSVNFFAVQPNKDEFQVLKNATFMFELDGSTTIRKVFVKPDGFIRFPFEMVDFEHLETTNNKYLIDAAGYVTNVGRTVQQKTCSKTLDFHLANSSAGYPMGVPWGVVDQKKEPTMLGCRLYLSSTSSTLILDDEEIPEIKQLKSDTSGAKFSKELLPVGCSDAKAGTLENLLMRSRNRKHDAATFHCTVRIDNVRTKNGWDFPSYGGEKCRKSVTRLNGRFLCESCNKNVDYPILRYRLELEVSDDTAEVVVVMFNETASSLHGDHHSPLPQALANIVGTSHTLDFKSHTYYEYNTYESFTCWRIVTAEGMDESGGSNMAGGSRASKTPKFKRLLRHPSVTTPSKGETAESDDEASFVADIHATSGVGGSLLDTRKHKRRVVDDNANEETMYRSHPSYQNAHVAARWISRMFERFQAMGSSTLRHYTGRKWTDDTMK